MATVAEEIRAATATLEQAGVPEARLDAALLLRHVLGWDRAQLLTRRQTTVSAGESQQYAGLIAQRARRRPLQYITGEQEFFGGFFRVNEAVLIPRPETELLIETALGLLPRGIPVRIVDIGTGSGAIAVTLARLLPQAQVLATDISAASLAVARSNAARHGVAGRVDFIEADLLPAGSGPFDLIASNPPYIAHRDAPALQPEVREFEPATALFAGEDGLTVYRRLVPLAATELAAGRALVMEIGAGQEAAVRSLLPAAAWRRVHTYDDLQGIPRTIAAFRHDIRE